MRDVATGRDLPDIVRWSKFSGASWRTRRQRILLLAATTSRRPTSKFKETNYFHKVYFHRLGTPQSTDLLIYERADHKDWNFRRSRPRTGATSSST